MTLQIELAPETEARLNQAAQASGIGAGKYLEVLLDEALGIPAREPKKRTKERLHAMLTALAEGSESRPELPASAYSRESFYEGRNVSTRWFLPDRHQGSNSLAQA